MKQKIDINDFLNLIYWVKTFFSFEGKKFNHESLLQQAESYQLKNTSLDIEIHHIDDLMIDGYAVYNKLHLAKSSVNDMFNTIELPLQSKDLLLKEILMYEKVYEDLMENCKFEDPEIRGIQKGMATEKMNHCVEIEDYENAAKYRDLIKAY